MQNVQNEGKNIKNIRFCKALFRDFLIFAPKINQHYRVNKMKKLYFKPEFKVVEIKEADIIATSDPTTRNYNFEGYEEDRNTFIF